MGLIGKTTPEKIWNFLKSKGLSSCGAAGLMGNLYAESGLNPQNLQNSYEKKLGHTDASYTAAVDNGSYGNFARDGAGYAMKAGEKESSTAEPLEALTATPAATVVINTTAPVTTTEKVAIATDNVPEGATETNADGTVNLYDAAGNITGSVTKEEAEKMAAEVTKIVDEEGNTLADLK